MIRAGLRSNLPPGPKGLPVLGNMLELERDTLGFLAAVQRRYGRLATVRFGQTPVVVVFDPELVRHILTEKPQSFVNGGVVGGLVYGKFMRLSLATHLTAAKAARPLLDLFGEGGLITGDGELHDRLRHVIQPAFSRRGLALLSDSIIEYTEELVDGWRADQVIDLVDAMRRLTLRVIFTVLFGRQLAGEFREGPALVDATLRVPSNLLDALLVRTGRSRANRFDRDLDTLIDRRAQAGPGDDVLWLLLSSEEPQGPNLSRRQIRDTIMALIAAGHETTTNNLVWTFYLLSRNPEVFARLRRHLSAVLGGRAPAHSDFAQLDYLDHVIKESMRLYPPGWVIGRVAREEVKLDGYTMPPGTRFLISQWVSHRHADIWPNADSFMPERWDPTHTVKPPTAVYYPFGLGRRICLGKSLSELEVMLVLPVVLQRFFPRLPRDAVVDPLPFATLKPGGGRVFARLHDVTRASAEASLAAAR